MPKSDKQKDNKGIFTPFTKPAVSIPEAPAPREMVRSSLYFK